MNTVEQKEVDASSQESIFLKELVRQWRAIDTNGIWDGKSDEELLQRYIVTKEKRKKMPIIGDPDPMTLQRFELFYNAAGLAVERLTGIPVAPVMKIHHEGFGRVVLIAGRLVVADRNVRDLHRYGYEDMALLSAEGEKIVTEAKQMIDRYPEIARLE